MNTLTRIKRSVGGLFAGALIALGTSFTPSASAEAVACDAITGAWGAIVPCCGVSAQTQINWAKQDAIAKGGNPNYIRAYYVDLPKNNFFFYATGYVSGKGWCGNWSYAPSYDVARANAIAGLTRQNGTSIRIVAWWYK